MFDGIINAAKGSVPLIVMFLVAGVVGSAIYQLVGGEGFNVEDIAKFAISSGLAGLTTSLVYGAAKG